MAFILIFIISSVICCSIKFFFYMYNKNCDFVNVILIFAGFYDILFIIVTKEASKIHVSVLHSVL